MNKCLSCLMLQSMGGPESEPSWCRKCYQEERIKNKRLKEILYKYMQVVRKIAGAIWDTKTQVSLTRLVEEMNRDFEQALGDERKGEQTK